MEKSELRILAKSRVCLLSADERRRQEERVWASVESLAEFVKARTVLVYMSLPDEVATSDFILRWQNAGKRIVLPRVVSDTSMELREYSPEKMERGAFGILEPGDSSLPADPSEIDFAIVPGVAFSRSGIRLGRGKGYYDRLLPSLRCPLVGVCYSAALFDSIPSEAWDVSMDKVISANDF